MPGVRLRIALFYVLCFLLLALIPLLHGLVVGGPMDFAAVAARASAETGLAWTSNLLTVLRLCMAEPALGLLVFGSAVPSAAALLVCAPRPARLRALLSRFAVRVPWREALASYGLLAGIMLVGLLAVFVLRSLLPGPAYTRPAGLFGPGLVAGLLVAAFLDQGAVLEELGWRGFAQTELQSCVPSPLAAAVCVGVGWGLWHVPRDVTTGVIERLGTLSYLALFLPSFLAGTVAISVLAAYFVNRCGGSVIPAIMVHGLANDAIGLSGAADIDRALTPHHQATKALPFAILALVLVAVVGRSLGRRAPELAPSAR